MAFNKVILLGRLTADPELKQTQSGKSVVTPGIALNEGKDKVTFVDFSAFDSTAEFISRYFHKGNPIVIEGRVVSRKFERDGKNHTELGIVCDRADFVESARSEQGGIISPQNAENATQTKSAPYMPSQYMPSASKQERFQEIVLQNEDDLPF